MAGVSPALADGGAGSTHAGAAGSRTRRGLSTRAAAWPRGLTVLALAALAFSAPARADSLGCLVAPSRIVNVGAPVPGVLSEVKVERGDRVAKGQMLATLRADLERAQVDLAGSRAQANADVQSAQKAYDFARRKLERNEDLFRKEFVSAQLVEQSRTEAELAQARLRQAQEQVRHSGKEFGVAAAQLRLRSVKSPIDGVVLERFLAEGERVEDRPILRVATLDPLHVEVVLPSGAYGQVRAGGEARVQAELAGLAPMQGRIILVDQVIDPASNTFRARIELPNPDGAVPAGLRCKASFPGLTPAVAAPSRPGARLDLPKASATAATPTVAARLPVQTAVVAPAAAPAVTPATAAARAAAPAVAVVPAVPSAPAARPIPPTAQTSQTSQAAQAAQTAPIAPIAPIAQTLQPVGTLTHTLAPTGAAGRATVRSGTVAPAPVLAVADVPATPGTYKLSLSLGASPTPTPTPTPLSPAATRR